MGNTTIPRNAGINVVRTFGDALQAAATHLEIAVDTLKGAVREFYEKNLLAKNSKPRGSKGPTMLDVVMDEARPAKAVETWTTSAPDTRQARIRYGTEEKGILSQQKAPLYLEVAGCKSTKPRGRTEEVFQLRVWRLGSSARSEVQKPVTPQKRMSG